MEKNQEAARNRTQVSGLRIHVCKEVGYWVPFHCMSNLLLHSLNNITAVGEHPKTEYELVLQLEGYSPTIKNVQDPEGNVEIPYIDYIMN